MVSLPFVFVLCLCEGGGGDGGGHVRPVLSLFLLSCLCLVICFLISYLRLVFVLSCLCPIFVSSCLVFVLPVSCMRLFRVSSLSLSCVCRVCVEPLCGPLVIVIVRCGFHYLCICLCLCLMWGLPCLCICLCFLSFYRVFVFVFVSSLSSTFSHPSSTFYAQD